MSSTLKLGNTTTGPIAPVIDAPNNIKTTNHGINITSHLNLQHASQNNTQEIISNPNSVHSNVPAPISCPVVPKVSSENATNCSPEKINVQTSPSTKSVQDLADDKKLLMNIPKTNNTLKTDVLDVVENKVSEVVNSVKHNLNSSVVSPNQVNQSNEITNNVCSTKTVETENKAPDEILCTNTKEQCENPKVTQANNNVALPVNSPSNMVSSSSSPSLNEVNASIQPPTSTTVQILENKTSIKPASTMKLATVSSRSHIKRKRELKTYTNSKKNLVSDSGDINNDDEDTGDNDQKSKRTRIKTQPYQSPLPEFALITKLSANMAKTKVNDDKLIIFYKNEFLAVRNSDGGFYICQAMQNIYKSSPKIRIRWLSQIKDDVSGETYSPDFYDFTDFDCILTNLNLNRMDKSLYKLPSSELDRTKSILQRALNVERGIASQLDITEEHPDGLDLSLYRDEAQLDKKKSRKVNKRKKSKINVVGSQEMKDPLRGISSKSKHLKKSYKKRKAGKTITLQATKPKSSKSKTSIKKSSEASPVNRTPTSSGSKTRQARAVTVLPSTSKAKSSVVVSKRKQDPSNTGSRLKRNTGRAPVAIVATSRTSRGSKSAKETRRGYK